MDFFSISNSFNNLNSKVKKVYVYKKIKILVNEFYIINILQY